MIPYRSVHFIGVLTPEMASLAMYTARLDIRVTASHDMSDSIYLEPLRAAGVSFFDMYAQVNVTKSTELVILSRYYDMRHIEADAALKLKIPVLSETDYAKLISEGTQRVALLGEYESRIIATFLHHVWQHGHIPHRSLTGTVTKDWRQSLASYDEAECFIIPLSGFKRDASVYEADFLSFESEVAIIPNIIYDYPELNMTLDDVYQSYYAFAKRVPRRGLIIGNGDYTRMKRLRVHLADRHIETYGFDRDNAWQIREVTNGEKETSFSLAHDKSIYGPFTIPYPGDIFVYSAAAVTIASLLMDMKMETLGESLKMLPQLRRCFERVADREGRIIIDDQSDYPMRIGKILRSIREIYPQKKIWCLYQPGSYLRTKALFNDFEKELSVADFVYLTDIKGYPREKSEGVNIRQLVAEMKRHHPQTYYFDDAMDMSGLLADRVASTDCIVTLGVEGLCQKITHPLLTK